MFVNISLTFLSRKTNRFIKRLFGDVDDYDHVFLYVMLPILFVPYSSYWGIYPI